MFSKLKSVHKNELRGVFKSLFGSSPSSRQCSPPGSPQKKKSRISFGKKMKARLLSFKFSDQWNKDRRMSRLSPEREGLYIGIGSADLVEDNQLNLSSILKTRKSLSSTHKKKLRFNDESIPPEDFCDKTEMTNVTTLSEVEKEATDSDVAYYMKLKEDLIQQNLQYMKSPLKRKASSAHTSPDNQTSNRKMKKIERSIDNSTIDDALNTTWSGATCSTRQNSIMHEEDPLEEKILNDTFVKLVGDTFFDDLNEESTSISHIEYFHKKFRSKLLKIKDVDNDDPLEGDNITQSCRVAVLSRQNSSHMSWCST